MRKKKTPIFFPIDQSASEIFENSSDLDFFFEFFISFIDAFFHSQILKDNRYLLYLDEHEALICKQCECAINETTNEVRMHFRKQHKTISLSDRKSLTTSTSELRVTAPKQLNKSARLTQSIEGIKLQRKFECKMC